MKVRLQVELSSTYQAFGLLEHTRLWTQLERQGEGYCNSVGPKVSSHRTLKWIDYDVGE